MQYGYRNMGAEPHRCHVTPKAPTPLQSTSFYNNNNNNINNSSKKKPTRTLGTVAYK